MIEIFAKYDVLIREKGHDYAYHRILNNNNELGFIGFYTTISFKPDKLLHSLSSALALDT